LKNRREQSLEFGTKPLQDNIKAMSILYWGPTSSFQPILTYFVHC
jgi:hypothetical protein